MKRIIIVGPAAGGKDYLKKRLGERGYKLDVSYTTRMPREGEVEDVDYHFVSLPQFQGRTMEKKMYEFVKHGDYYYGTGQWEWDNCDVFIMEASAIINLPPEDRAESFVIYLNPPKEDRFERLWTNGRGWDYVKITNRFEVDDELFNDFKDYDIEIKNPDF